MKYIWGLEKTGKFIIVFVHNKIFMATLFTQMKKFSMLPQSLFYIVHQ